MSPSPSPTPTPSPTLQPGAAQLATHPLLPLELAAEAGSALFCLGMLLAAAVFLRRWLRARRATGGEASAADLILNSGKASLNAGTGGDVELGFVVLSRQQLLAEAQG